MTTAATHGIGRMSPLPAPPERAVLVAIAAIPHAVPALRGIVRRVSLHWGLPDAVVDALMLISSELVTNVVVHSGSPDVELLLTADQEQAVLRVRDHGLWHAPRERPGSLPPDGRGLDLVRAHSELNLACSPDGTAITARLPLNLPGTQGS